MKFFRRMYTKTYCLVCGAESYGSAYCSASCAAAGSKRWRWVSWNSGRVR